MSTLQKKRARHQHSIKQQTDKKKSTINKIISDPLLHVDKKDQPSFIHTPPNSTTHNLPADPYRPAIKISRKPPLSVNRAKAADEALIRRVCTSDLHFGLEKMISGWKSETARRLVGTFITSKGCVESVAMAPAMAADKVCTNVALLETAPSDVT